jgi:hypothetical protein
MSSHVNMILTIGNTLSPYMHNVFYERIPEYPPLSPPVFPRPAREVPERKKIL